MHVLGACFIPLDCEHPGKEGSKSVTMMQVKPRVDRPKVRVQASRPPLLPDQPLVLIEPAHKHLPDPLAGSKRERVMQQSEKRLRIVGGEESVPPKGAEVRDGVER
jgi:hypothetical protein